MKRYRTFTIRDMYEDYLATQWRANQIVDNDMHCWIVLEKYEKTLTRYDWLGEKLGVDVITGYQTVYVWLGPKGAITITKTPTFHKGDKVMTNIEANMKEWVRKTYYPNLK